MGLYDNYAAVMEQINQAWRQSEFSKLLGISMIELSDEIGIAEMPLDNDKGNGNGEIQGGAYFSLADNAAGAAAWTWGKRNLGEDTTCVTVSSSFNFLRPTRNCRKAICKVTPRHTNHTVMMVDAVVYNEHGVKLCTGTFHMSFVQLDRYKNSRF